MYVGWYRLSPTLPPLARLVLGNSSRHITTLKRRTAVGHRQVLLPLPSFFLSPREFFSIQNILTKRTALLEGVMLSVVTRPMRGAALIPPELCYYNVNKVDGIL